MYCELKLPALVCSVGNTALVCSVGNTISLAFQVVL